MRAKPAPGGGLPPGKPPPLDLVMACSRCMYSSMGFLLDMVGGAGQPFCAVEQPRLGGWMWMLASGGSAVCLGVAAKLQSASQTSRAPSSGVIIDFHPTGIRTLRS